MKEKCINSFATQNVISNVLSTECDLGQGMMINSSAYKRKGQLILVSAVTQSINMSSSNLCLLQ